MSINTQSDTVRTKDYDDSIKEVEKATIKLCQDNPYELCMALATEFGEPNWQRHGFESKDKALRKARNIIKKLEENSEWMIK